MKRSLLKSGVWGFLLAAFLSITMQFAPQMASATAALDQSNESIGGTYNNVNVWNSYQTFTPSKQYLDSVSVYVAGNSFADTITISIVDLDLTAHASGTTSVPSGGGTWRKVTFADPIDLYAGASHQHGIKVTSNSGNTSWNASDSNTYSGGCAYKNWVCQGYDLVFQTYGHDDVLPTPDGGTTTPGTTTTSTTSTVSSNAPAAATSAAIAAPTNLKAEYAGADKTVNLSWTKSTSTDITGYKVFRSEVKGKNYSKLGQTNTKTLTYADKNVEAGKTYYYIVRSIKSTEESVNSNEISVAIAADGATAQVVKETGHLVSYTPLSIVDYSKFPLIFWILVAAVVVLDIVLAVLISRRHKLSKKINDKN